MPLLPPLEPAPSFGELSCDELSHRYARGILTPEELVRDAIANLRAVLPYGGLRPPEHPGATEFPRPPTGIGRLHGITFVSPLVPGPESVLTHLALAAGGTQVGQTVSEPGHHPLAPGQRLTGPWAGGAIALLGWAAPLALGVDATGDLARMVLQTGLPGFRIGGSHKTATPGWLYRYLVDAVSITSALVPSQPTPSDFHLHWNLSADSEELAGPVLTALRKRASEAPGAGITIRVTRLTPESVELASRESLAAAYIPWRWGSPKATAFQLLAPEGSEAALAVAARSLAGPASLI